MEESITIRKGVELGSGAYGRVFKAVENGTGRVVALKQSRAPLRLKRPTLQHEARVLKHLSGHPNIPEVYAYGRIEHFELMSMQLLDRSLEGVVKDGCPLGIKTVAIIASQMLDALQHLNSHQLVHRDIKPGNILLQTSESWKVCLIDFGLARASPSSDAAITPTDYTDYNSTSDRPAYLFGTLPYASLNAHEKDAQLTFRDDAESLAYSLLWLLRGSLPWSYYAKRGTQVGRIRQVFAQKKRHSGSSLATGLPCEFGELVDYSRALSPDEKPDYNEWRRRFNQIEESTTGAPELVTNLPISKTSAVRPEPPVEAGQVVLIKLDSPITGEGYTIQEGHELSFIPDPFFSDPAWATKYRPAVIIQVNWNERARKYAFLATCISRGSDTGENSAIRIAPVSDIDYSHNSNAPSTVHTEPGWPLEDSYFYVFKRPVEFYCLPSQEQIHTRWRIDSSQCATLLVKFTPPPDLMSESQERRDIKSSDPDIRHDARMRRWAGYCKLYARVEPLAQIILDDDSIDWFSTRAWFDECIKIQRHKNLLGGCWWTGAWYPSAYHPKEGDVLDSYDESDYSMWQAQEERRKSITLGDSQEDIPNGNGILEGLVKIVGLEQETEA